MRSREAGFTMVEVMVALLLAAIAMMGIIGLYMTSSKAAGFSRHTTEAAILAEDRIEKLRTTTPAVAVTATELNLDAQGNAGSGIYTRAYTVQLATNYATVQVVMSWFDDGVAHTFTTTSRRNLP